jgi:hypothetical protein
MKYLKQKFIINQKIIFKSFIKNFLLKIYIYIYGYSNDKIINFLKKIKIIDSGNELIRIGTTADGGYLLPNILDEIDYCFSPGVGNSTSFEDHLLKYNIKSFLADGTIDYKDHEGNHNFTKKNLNSFDDENNITLSKWIDDKVPDKSNNKLILQMDIEGSEINCLYNIPLDYLDRFKIIIIEFHNFHDIISKLGLKIYNDLFDKILNTHHIVHIHPNNFAHNTLRIMNTEICSLYEITFINKKNCKSVKKINYNLPHILDKKNIPENKEVKCPEMFYK